MIISMLLVTGVLSGCGSNAEPLSPAAPPRPPPVFSDIQPNSELVQGVVSDVSPATRSWVMSYDGQRTIAVLSAQGVIEVNGTPVSLNELPVGAMAQAQGLTNGDIVVVRRVTVGAVAEAGSKPITDAPPGAVSPAAEATAAPEAPAAPTTDAPAAPETAAPSAPATP